MTGLLYNIRNYLKATYSGRYLAYVLAELFAISPEQFANVLKVFGLKYRRQRGDHVIANSWRFGIAKTQSYSIHAHTTQKPCSARDAIVKTSALGSLYLTVPSTRPIAPQAL